MAIIWDKQTYEQMYTCTGWTWGVRNFPKTPRFHYNWFGCQGQTRAIVDRYLAIPDFDQINTIAIVGSGFGWVAEELQKLGKTVVGTEISPHILSQKDTSEEAELREYLAETGFDPDNLPVMLGPDYNTPVNPWDFWLRPDGVRTSVTVADNDLTTDNQRQNIRNLLNGSVDLVVTEYAIDSYDAGNDEGSLSLVEQCERLKSSNNTRVVHLVEPNPADQFLNVKDASKWRNLLDTNGFTNHLVVTKSEVS